MALGLDAGILLMVSIIATVAFIAVVNGILIPATQEWFRDAMIRMPKFDYNNNTNTGNENYNTYQNLMKIAIPIIAIAMTFAGAVIILEEFYIFRKEQGISIVTRGVMYIIFLLLFPSLWDLFANGIEQISYYIINPDDPSDMNSINNRIQYIFQYIGGIIPPDVNWDTVLQFLTNPNDAAQTIFRDVFLAVFKAFIAAMAVFLMFVIGTVRIVLTAIMTVAIPLILAFSLFPFADRVFSRLKDILIGLSFAPVLSALVITAGVAFLNSTPLSPLQQWMAAIAIGFLAILIPTITAPVVGSLVTQLTTIGTGAMLASLYMGSQTITGMARGVATTFSTLSQSGVFNSLPLSKKAITLGAGAIKGLGAGLTSGVLAQTAEAAKSIGMGRLAEPVYQVLPRITAKIPSLSARHANSLVTSYKGSAIEGVLAFNMLNADPNTVNEYEATQFVNSLKGMDNEQVADTLNKYLNVKMHDSQKNVIGHGLKEIVNAVSSNPDTTKAFYASLLNIQQQGGIEGMIKNNPNRINDYINASDYIKTKVESKYGIELPDGLHVYDIAIKPDDAVITPVYEAKYAIGTLLKNVEERVKVGDVPQVSDIKMQGMKDMLEAKITSMLPEDARKNVDIKELAGEIFHRIKRDYGETGKKILYDEIVSGSWITNKEISSKVVDLSDKVFKEEEALGFKKNDNYLGYFFNQSK